MHIQADPWPSQGVLQRYPVGLSADFLAISVGEALPRMLGSPFRKSDSQHRNVCRGPVSAAATVSRA